MNNPVMHADPSGYRYYSEDSILSYTQERKTKKDLNVIGYARVSSKKQTDDLERQVNNLKIYLDNKYKSYDIITDIGSGINYTKKGLHLLIEKINKKEVDIIVVLYKDRLLRFGFELVEYFARINNVKIEVLDKINKTQDEELVEDLIQIITTFSCKIQGKRKAKTKEILEKSKTKVLKFKEIKTISEELKPTKDGKKFFNTLIPEPENITSKDIKNEMKKRNEN